ncbi:MAG: hypothetical protein LUG95_09225 [Clostridiales bacterium]|nr:hypothetical protein [Clostridiales bacterium]
MKKGYKITISVLAVILVVILIYDSLLIYSDKTESEESSQTTVTEEQTTQIQYPDPVERQAREMIEDMTLYEKVGQMLLYYIPKEEPLEKNGKVAVRRVYYVFP